MKQLKYFLYTNFSIVCSFALCCCLPVILLMLRMKLTHDFFLLFLVWNLFLAALPFCISFGLMKKEKLSKGQLIGWFVPWVLFLPNAPYILTDVIHLNIHNGAIFWLDAIVIGSFASGGIWLYVVSLQQMKYLAQQYFSNYLVKSTFLTLPFLCGFGVYIGRFLRFNSWDVVYNPLGLLQQLVSLIHAPPTIFAAAIFSLAMGLLLLVTAFCFKKAKVCVG